MILYPILAIGTSLFFLVLTILLPNVPLVFELLKDAHEPFLKMKIILGLLSGIKTNFSSLSFILSFFIALLFGIYVSLFMYLLKKRQKTFGTKKGLIGAISGMIGLHCTTCGAFLLSMIFSTTGAVAIIALLPFKGVEFSIVSIILLLLSILMLVKNIIT